MLKKTISLILAISMFFTLLLCAPVSVNAETASQTVTEWDFNKIADGDYGFANAGPVTSSDGKIILGHNDAQTWWNQWKGWSVKSGVLTHTNTRYSANQNQLVMALKVDCNFNKGVTYNLETDLEIVSHGESWYIPKWLHVYYSPTLHNSATKDSDEIPEGSMSIYCNGSYAEGTTFTTFPNEFSFTPQENYSSDGYIMIRVGMSGVDPAVITISQAKITAKTNSSTTFAWDFKKIADGDYGMGNVPATESSDGNIVLGCSGSYWNNWTGWNVKSGVLTAKNAFYQVAGVHHIISLKVGVSLKKDVAYNLKTDLEVLSHGEGDYRPNWCHVYYTEKLDNVYRADANPTQDYESIYYISGGFTTLPSEFLFTPKEDLAAGGYITIRMGMGTTDANTTMKLSKAELTVDTGMKERFPRLSLRSPLLMIAVCFTIKLFYPRLIIN